MGVKFDTFIDGLNDHEFAVYVGHQYESFLPYAKEKVQNEIDLRELTKSDLDTYFNTRLSNFENGNTCENCGSDRFIEDKDIEHTGSQYGSAELEVTTNRCRLCNYNPSKTVEKNLFKRIKRYFFDDNKTTKTLRTYYWVDDKPHYPSNR